MEESRKGAAPGSSKKNSSASVDEDFGKDFLNSWKPSNFGKDSMDFDVEPIGGKSKKFNFGKMDDFDLGEDFGKLPSFQMDLDFSSPVKKTGAKPSNEKASMESFLGKKGKEKDEFSFNFDFDDHFGKFDLDSEISKEKKNTQAQPTASITSSDQNKSKTQNHFSKFDLDSEVSKEKKNTQAQPTASITSSDQNITKSKTQNQNNSNMDIDTANNNNNNNNTLKNDTTSKIPSKSHTSTENINTVKQSKQPSDNLSNASNSSSKINNRVITREESKEFSLPSVSGNNSSSSRRFREVFDKSDKQERETANSVQSMGSSSHSRSASPVVSSANREEIKEKDGQTQSQNNLGQTRSSDSDKSLSNVVLPPAIHRNSTPVREKLSASLLYKPQQTSILATKQACDIANKKIEGMNLLSSDMRRDSKKSDEQNEISKIGLLTTLEKPSTKEASVGAGNSKIETENRTFSILRSNTNSSLLTSKGLMRDEKQTLVSRLVKLNPRSPTPNPTISQEKDLKSAKFSERNNKASLSPQNKTPTAPPPVPLFPSKEKEREKPSFLSPSLKRKLSEESGPDPFIRNPLKRISSNSPVETRKSPEIIPKSPKMIAGNGSPLEINNNLISPIVLPDFEMPVFLENNSNVEKAEKISKDLDDICSMLKKKQEEAKELLVRAVVNNNKLLMLNHPMYDEKLRSLESFAATLCAKHVIS